MKEHSALERFRTRWRRWLGNKTRWDKPYWTTLLDSNWLGWVDKVYNAHDFDYHGLSFTSCREEVKLIYGRAIDNATMDHLYKLDEIYANQIFEDRFK